MIDKPSGGRILYEGQDVYKASSYYKSRLGYLPQSIGLIPALSGREFLMYIAAMKGLPGREAALVVEELLESLNLSGIGDQPIQSYSGGMKQRVGIGQALLNQPSVLLLDEPTVGLDPDERVFFKQLIAKYAERSTVILSTHIVSDVEALATHIIIMKKGRVLASGDSRTLKQSLHGKVWRIPAAGTGTDLKVPHIYGGSQMNREGLETRVLSYTRPAPYAVETEPSLEDVYLYYMHQNQLVQDSSGRSHPLDGHGGLAGGL
ncbi:ABC transporter ATP-binding protein [Paenibacillus sp. PK3_47]|uniref:ABC transporter ATP-binding protein n=1 Tax=Paenibacillus sp. PK3_47 TaxID=2072642 RepID=UPI00201E4486|nr:ABC transporter ATP-binding protein [Paenibacillus sp. PK3_47]